MGIIASILTPNPPGENYANIAFAYVILPRSLPILNGLRNQNNAMQAGQALRG